MKAIEATGRIEKSGQLRLDKPLSLRSKNKVKIIVLFNDEDDFSEALWQKAMSTNPAFDFLNDERENIYSASDGKPIRK